MGKKFVVCSRCGKKLFDSAVCVPCENARAREEDRNFKTMVSGIVRVIKAARTHMKATIKESRFSIKELKLDPEVLLFIKKKGRYRKKRK